MKIDKPEFYSEISADTPETEQDDKNRNEIENILTAPGAQTLQNTNIQMILSTEEDKDRKVFITSFSYNFRNPPNITDKINIRTCELNEWLISATFKEILNDINRYFLSGPSPQVKIFWTEVFSKFCEQKITTKCANLEEAINTIKEINKMYGKKTINRLLITTNEVTAEITNTPIDKFKDSYRLIGEIERQKIKNKR